MGGTSLGNLSFTLYLINATSGFSDDQDGFDHYLNLCKQNGLLPVGCGSNNHNCDKNRFNDEPCLPMPESWGCNVMTKIKSTTGWGSNIVAILASSLHSSFLYKPSQYPNGGENLQAVCGKASGIS